MRHFFSQNLILITLCVLLIPLFPAVTLSQDLSSENDAGTNSTPQAPEIYVDQVIDAESLAKQIEAEKKRDRVIAPGWNPGSLGVTYRYYNNDIDDRAEFTEHGVELRWRQETQEHGSYEIQIDGLTSEGYDAFREPNGHRIQVRQNNYVINTELQLDSDFINYRSVAPRLITESYRFRLPSTILQGMGNRIYSKDTTFFLNFGEIGRYEGVAARAYEATQGNLQGMGMEHRLNNQLDFALQFWNTQDPEIGYTHQSLSGTVQYQLNPYAQNHQLHLLSDSNGKTGLWYDAYLRIGRWTHRAGTQYIPPDLLWTDVTINNDRKGIYWRGDRNSFRWLWSLGSEISKNNLDDDPGIPGYITTASFANVTWQFRRNTQFGGSVNMQSNTADSGTADNNNYKHTYKAFASHLFPFGRTRLQPQIDIWDTYPERKERHGLRWDQDWALKLFDRLNSNTQYYTSDRREDDFNFQIYLEKYLFRNLRTSGSFQQFYTRFDDVGVTKVSSFSLGLGWQFLNNWLMSLNADYNTGSFDPDDGSEAKIKGTRILFSINYNIDMGTRPSLYGVDTGEPGRGRVVGRVFLDENRNGHFDLGEEALANITVYLDGRFTTETGPNGGFEFWPVASGEHFITIALQDVPLPWSLMDEAPQRIVVPVRGEAEFNVALVRINE
ncbi:MAG: hypothetical protein JRE12_13120 [Deltaproteobacteria bacterium]|nr:hypothetical protein [Deltaproteobacteria bacterium]